MIAMSLRIPNGCGKEMHRLTISADIFISSSTAFVQFLSVEKISEYCNCSKVVFTQLRFIQGDTVIVNGINDITFLTTSFKIVQSFVNMIKINPVVVNLHVNAFRGTSFDAVSSHLFPRRVWLIKQIPKYKRNTITLLKMLRTFLKKNE